MSIDFMEQKMVSVRAQGSQEPFTISRLSRCPFLRLARGTERVEGRSTRGESTLVQHHISHNRLGRHPDLIFFRSTCMLNSIKVRSTSPGRKGEGPDFLSSSCPTGPPGGDRGRDSVVRQEEAPAAGPWSISVASPGALSPDRRRLCRPRRPSRRRTCLPWGAASPIFRRPHPRRRGCRVVL